MTDEPRKIETHGDLSPGYVGGNFTVTQTIINQHASIARKKWRQLDGTNYPAVPEDNEDRRNRYAIQLAFHLHRAFKDTGYISFCGLINSRTFPGETPDSRIVAYSLVSPYAAFTRELRQSLGFFVNPSVDLKAKQDYQDSLQAELQYLLTWTLDLQTALSSAFIPHLFTYDPDAKRISIGPPPILSGSPTDYPDKVGTTSEVLCFLASFASSPILNFDGMDLLEDNYPLLKLVLELLDNRSWDLNKLRVNASDCEEWDYINTAADAEISEYKRKRKGQGRDKS